MLDPVSNASNLFLGFFQVLPQPVQALVYLSIGLFVIVAIVYMVFR